MRSFRLPTRIDGCTGFRENITVSFNTTTVLVQTVIKYILKNFIIEKILFLLCRKNPLNRFYGMSYFWYTLFSIFTALVVSLVVSFFTGRIDRKKKE